MNTNRKMLKLLSWCMVTMMSFALAGGAQAEEIAPGGGIEVGLRTSLGSASHVNNAWNNSRSVLSGGAFVGYAFSRVFSFETSMAYVEKGSSRVDGTYAVERMEVAPILVISSPVKSKVRPALLGGITFAFGGSSRLETEGLDTQDFSQRQKSLKVGFVIGARLSHQRNNTRVFADIRYSRDFGNTDAYQVLSVGVGVGLTYCPWKRIF